MKLDMTKPYAEIHGFCAAKYEQDDRFFDADGNEITLEGEPVGESLTPAEKRAATLAAKKEAVNPELEAQIAAQGV